MSRLEEIKQHFHVSAVSQSDLIWLFEKITELEQAVIKDKPYLEVAEKNAKYIVELEAKLKLQIHNATKQRAIANEAIDKWSKVRDKLKFAEKGLQKIVDGKWEGTICEFARTLLEQLHRSAIDE